MDHLQYLSQLITTFNHDVKAEVILGDLLKSGDLDFDQFIIQKDGQFTRAYRFDILNAEVVDFDYDSKQFLKLILSRDSIYDMLPEGVTHQSKHDVPGKGVDTMIKEYNIRKKQQKAARNFFQPFENEFFRYGVETELFESEFLHELNGSKAPEMFYNFWNISQDFPPLLVSKFIKLLPFAYKIVGDISLAAHILSILLEEEVKVTDREYQEYSDDDQGILLGESRLGLDFITGNSYDDYSKHLDIKIGPLRNASFTEFIHEGNKKKFVDMFYEHFFPLEVEIKTIVLLPEEKQKFEFDNQTEPILGYNTCI